MWSAYYHPILSNFNYRIGRAEGTAINCISDLRSLAMCGKNASMYFHGRGAALYLIRMLDRSITSNCADRFAIDCSGITTGRQTTPRLRRTQFPRGEPALNSNPIVFIVTCRSDYERGFHRGPRPVAVRSWRHRRRVEGDRTVVGSSKGKKGQGCLAFTLITLRRLLPTPSGHGLAVLHMVSALPRRQETCCMIRAQPTKILRGPV